ncbi:MAG: tRNA(Ile)-lysidine synthetase, partial [Clostridia bacterium]|nr:tRNA(Ile)-lysidine synthetase [Clostridia bacterium]
MNTNTLVVFEKAKRAIDEYAMLKKGSKVIVGLSGGADSVCLLHFLNSIKNEYDLTIVSAHINHGIRGDEADRDCEFSREFSESLNVSFKLLEVECVKEAQENGETVEEAGRRIRYE